MKKTSCYSCCRDLAKCGHTAFVVEVLKFPELLIAPAVQHRSSHGSHSLPFVACPPKGYHQQQEDRMAASLEIHVWFSFCFSYRFPSTNPGDRRIIPIGRDRR